MNIFLDRDGVVLKAAEVGDYISYIHEAQLETNVIKAFDLMKEHDVFVVTNQAGIAYGKVDPGQVKKIHGWLHSLGIKDFFVCPHGKYDGCKCRKPKDGLLKEAMKKWNIVQPEECWMVGDWISDLQAGYSVGMKTVLVRSGRGTDLLHAIRYDKRKRAIMNEINPMVAANLIHFARFAAGIGELTPYAETPEGKYLFQKTGHTNKEKVSGEMLENIETLRSTVL